MAVIAKLRRARRIPRSRPSLEQQHNPSRHSSKDRRARPSGTKHSCPRRFQVGWLSEKQGCPPASRSFKPFLLSLASGIQARGHRRSNMCVRSLAKALYRHRTSLGSVSEWRCLRHHQLPIRACLPTTTALSRCKGLASQTSHRGSCPAESEANLSGLTVWNLPTLWFGTE